MQVDRGRQSWTRSTLYLVSRSRSRIPGLRISPGHPSIMGTEKQTGYFLAAKTEAERAFGHAARQGRRNRRSDGTVICRAYSSTPLSRWTVMLVRSEG